MAIEHAFTYMVHPQKGDPEAKSINGSAVPLTDGKMFDLLKEVYEKSDRECDIDIAFNPTKEGQPDNPCRNLVRAFAASPTVESGREIAHRLRSFTDGRSGPGLLFVILGREDEAYKVLISRFPADSGILAEEKQSELSIEFLERIFLKSAHSYKAALFRHTSIDGGFWDGRAVDKQTSSPTVLASDYWVGDFLASDFSTTSAAGTKRLATALREATKLTNNPTVKEEIIATATMAKNLNGQTISIEELKVRFSLSDEAFSAIKNSLKNPDTAGETFKFNYSEFSDHLPFRSMVLDSGVTITAPVSKFQELVTEGPSRTDGEPTFIVSGRIVNQRLQKA
jgi:hypothetical protein